MLLFLCCLIGVFFFVYFAKKKKMPVPDCVFNVILHCNKKIINPNLLIICMTIDVHRGPQIY